MIPSSRTERRVSERRSGIGAVLWSTRDVTYEKLAERLRGHGFAETKASIANKLARATVPTAFFLACLGALELEGVRLEDL